MKKKILISTGGSGGHVVPALVIHEHLKETCDILLTTDKRGLKYLKEKNNNFQIINIISPKNFIFFFISLINCIFKSLTILKRNKIETVISTGGYMSLPICIASRILNINTYLFEPNLVLGRSNKFYLSFCKKILCYSNKIKNFPNKYLKKIEIIKPLIRKEFYNKQSQKIYNPRENLNILIIGGSQGALIFDTLLKEPILELKKYHNLFIRHQSTNQNSKSLENFYKRENIKFELFKFDNNIVNALKDTDLCITRSGASTLSELVILNIPFITIPLPGSKDEHQFYNAKFFEEKGFCWIYDQNIKNDNLSGLLRKILSDDNEYFEKKNNMREFCYKSSWNDVNQKLLSVINYGN